MGNRLTPKTKSRLWLAAFFFGPLFANPGSFALFLLLMAAAGLVLGPDFYAGGSIWGVVFTIALLTGLAWGLARRAIRSGAPSTIWVAASLGSVLSAVAALQSLYELVKPATPGMLAEPSIAEAVRDAAAFGLWIYGALALCIPVAVFLAVRQARRSGLKPGAAGIEQALPADGGYAGQ